MRRNIWIATRMAGALLTLLSLVVGCARNDIFDTPVVWEEHANSLRPAANLPRPTDSIRKQYYSTWPKSMRQAVNQHLLVIGMDKLQAQVSLGILESSITKDVMARPSGVTEIWHVWHYPGGWSPARPGDQEVAITFQDGMLTEFHRLQ